MSVVGVGVVVEEEEEEEEEESKESEAAKMRTWCLPSARARTARASFFESSGRANVDSDRLKPGYILIL